MKFCFALNVIAIMHPYLASLRGQMGEPVCPKHYLEWGSSFKENYNDLKEVFQKVRLKNSLIFDCLSPPLDLITKTSTYSHPFPTAILIGFV